MLEGKKKKGPFTRLAFRLLSDASLAGPAPGFLMFALHVRPSPGPCPAGGTSRPVPERGRQREGDTLHPRLAPAPPKCTPTRPLPPLPGSSLPAEPAQETGGSQRPGRGFLAAGKGRCSEATFLSPRTPGACAGPALPPSPHLPLSLLEKHVPRSPAATPAVTLMTRL